MCYRFDELNSTVISVVTSSVIYAGAEANPPSAMAVLGALVYALYTEALEHLPGEIHCSSNMCYKLTTCYIRTRTYLNIFKKNIIKQICNYI